MRRKKTFQLEKENIPIRKRKIFQLEKGNFKPQMLPIFHYDQVNEGRIAHILCVKVFL